MKIWGSTHIRQTAGRRCHRMPVNFPRYGVSSRTAPSCQPQWRRACAAGL